MSRVRDVLAMLSVAAGAAAIEPVLVRQRPWASALFVGERLRVAVTAMDGDALDTWLATLPDMDLPIRGGFVASTEVMDRATGRAVLELLIVDA